jgi:hypothetical protein
MNSLKAMIACFAVVVVSGCAADSGGGDEGRACEGALAALPASPASGDLAAAAGELKRLGCADGEAETRLVGSVGVQSDQCGCDGSYCVCTCGDGGSCTNEGTTWYCGC